MLPLRKKPLINVIYVQSKARDVFNDSSLELVTSNGQIQSWFKDQLQDRIANKRMAWPNYRRFSFPS